MCVEIIIPYYDFVKSHIMTCYWMTAWSLGFLNKVTVVVLKSILSVEHQKNKCPSNIIAWFTFFKLHNFTEDPAISSCN